MRKTIIIGLSVAAALGLSACSEKSQDKVEQAGDAIGNDLERGINNADDKVAAGADHVGAAIDNAGDHISAATKDVRADVKDEARDAKHSVGGALEETGKDIKD